MSCAAATMATNDVNLATGKTTYYLFAENSLT
jgi:hypothetical protein